MTESIFHKPLLSAFGFHSFMFSSHRFQNEKNATYNVGRAAAWIPVIGTIIGIIHLKAAYSDLREAKKENEPDPFKISYAKARIFRASIEIAFLGFLLVLPDIIATIGRMLSPHLEAMNDISFIE